MQLDMFCQRWNRRRPSYRPAGELFDARRACVEPIEEREAKTFVVTHHYSGTYPAARFRAGVFIKEPFNKARLAGVGVFSVPMNQRVVPAYFAGLQPEEGVELGRFVLDDSLAANAESWALARTMRTSACISSAPPRARLTRLGLTMCSGSREPVGCGRSRHPGNLTFSWSFR